MEIRLPHLVKKIKSQSNPEFSNLKGKGNCFSKLGDWETGDQIVWLGLKQMQGKWLLIGSSYQDFTVLSKIFTFAAVCTYKLSFDDCTG